MAPVTSVLLLQLIQSLWIDVAVLGKRVPSSVAASQHFPKSSAKEISAFSETFAKKTPNSSSKNSLFSSSKDEARKDSNNHSKFSKANQSKTQEQSNTKDDRTSTLGTKDAAIGTKDTAFSFLKSIFSRPRLSSNPKIYSPAGSPRNITPASSTDSYPHSKSLKQEVASHSKSLNCKTQQVTALPSVSSLTFNHNEEPAANFNDQEKHVNDKKFFVSSQETPSDPSLASETPSESPSASETPSKNPSTTTLTDVLQPSETPSTATLTDVVQPIFDSHLVRNGFPKLGGELTTIFEPFVILGKQRPNPNIHDNPTTHDNAIMKDSTTPAIMKDNSTLATSRNSTLTILKDLEVLSNKFESLEIEMHPLEGRTRAYYREYNKCLSNPNFTTNPTNLGSNLDLGGTQPENSGLVPILFFGGQPSLKRMEDLILKLRTLEREKKTIVKKMKQKLSLFWEHYFAYVVEWNLEWTNAAAATAAAAAEKTRNAAEKTRNAAEKTRNAAEKTRSAAEKTRNTVTAEDCPTRSVGGNVDGAQNHTFGMNGAHGKTEKIHSIETSTNRAHGKTKTHTTETKSHAIETRPFTIELKSYIKYKSAKNYYDKNKHWRGFGLVIEIGRKIETLYTSQMFGKKIESQSLRPNTVSEIESTKWPKIESTKWPNTFFYKDLAILNIDVRNRMNIADRDVFRKNKYDLPAMIRFVSYVDIAFVDLKRWKNMVDEIILIPIFTKFILPVGLVCKEFSSPFSSSLKSFIGPGGEENHSSEWSQLLLGLKIFRVLLKVGIQIRKESA